MRVYLECGQKWWRIHKWRHGWKRRALGPNGKYGFAHGPFLFLHKVD